MFDLSVDKAVKLKLFEHEANEIIVAVYETTTIGFKSHCLWKRVKFHRVKNKQSQPMQNDVKQLPAGMCSIVSNTRSSS